MIMKLLNNQDYMDTGPTSVPACPTVPLQKAATCRVKDTSMICQVCYYNKYVIMLQTRKILTILSYLGHMGAESINSGYKQRSNLFRKNIEDGNEFQPATFIGRLHHDLVSGAMTNVLFEWPQILY